jgi:hypothetical protein
LVLWCRCWEEPERGGDRNLGEGEGGLPWGLAGARGGGGGTRSGGRRGGGGGAGARWRSGLAAGVVEDRAGGGARWRSDGGGSMGWRQRCGGAGTGGARVGGIEERRAGR